MVKLTDVMTMAKAPATTAAVIINPLVVFKCNRMPGISMG
jgi:hypothetical protein